MIKFMVVAPLGCSSAFSLAFIYSVHVAAPDLFDTPCPSLLTLCGLHSIEIPEELGAYAVFEADAQLIREQPSPNGLLHYAMRTPCRRSSIQFWVGLLGMTVLRHHEFINKVCVCYKTTLNQCPRQTKHADFLLCTG